MRDDKSGDSFIDIFMAASKKDAEDGMKAEYSEFIEEAKDDGEEFVLDEVILWRD